MRTETLRSLKVGYILCCNFVFILRVLYVLQASTVCTCKPLISER